MKNSYPHITRSGSTVTIEARTMAEADAAAEAALGPGFSVVSVRRLRRGGVGGFFALELVELVASAGPREEKPAEMASAEELLQILQRNDGDFATRLLDRMGDVDEDLTIAQLFSTARAAGVPDSVAWEELIEPALRAGGGYDPEHHEAEPTRAAAPPVWADEPAPAADALASVLGAAHGVTPAPAPAPVAPVAPVAPAPLPAAPAVDRTPPEVVMDAAGAPPLPSRAAARAAAATEPAAPTRAVAPATADTPPLPRYPVNLPPRVAPPGSTGPLAEMPPRAMRFDEQEGRWVEDVPTPDGEVPPIAGWVADPLPVIEPPADAIPAAAALAPVPVAPPASPLPPPPPPAGTLAPPPPPPPPPVPVTPTPVAAAMPVTAAPVADDRSVEVTLDLTLDLTTPAADDGEVMQQWLAILQTPEPVLGDDELGPARPPAPAVVAAVDALDALPVLGGPIVPTVDAAPPRVGPGVVLSVASADTVHPDLDADAGVDLFADLPSEVLAALAAPTVVPTVDVPVAAPSAAASLAAALAAAELELADLDERTDADRAGPATADDALLPDETTMVRDEVAADLPAAEPPGDVRPGGGLDALRPTRRTTNWRARPIPTDDNQLAGTVAAFTAPAIHVDRADADHAVVAGPAAESGRAAETEPVVDERTEVEPDVADVEVEPTDTADVTVAPDGDTSAAIAPTAPVDRTAPEPAPAVDAVAPAAPAAPVAPAVVVVEAAPVPLTFRSLLPDEPITAVEGPTTDGWSAQALFAVGVPDRIVQTAAALDPRDDAEWTAALMLALRPLFAPLPTGTSLVVGPTVGRLAEALDIPVVDLEAGAPVDGDVIAVETEDPADVVPLRQGRAVHLVVGGMWHELVRLRPVVVSAAGPRFLLPALSVAHAWGVPLGYMAGVQTVRLDAVTVAMEIRSTLGLDVEAPQAPAHPDPSRP